MAKTFSGRINGATRTGLRKPVRPNPSSSQGRPAGGIRGQLKVGARGKSSKGTGGGG